MSSCASSPSYTSCGQQTPSATHNSNNSFFFSSDATVATTYYGNAFYGTGAGAGSPVHHQVLNNNVALLNEVSDETYSYAYGSNENDWMLFNKSHDDLPIIDYETAKFFEDADASIRTASSTQEQAQAPSNAVAYAAASQADAAAVQEEEEMEIDLDDLSYDNTTHTHMRDIYNSLNAFEISPPNDYVPAEEFEQEVQQESLLYNWAYDYQRHEWIAMKFQQPPYMTVRQPEQQQQ